MPEAAAITTAHFLAWFICGCDGGANHFVTFRSADSGTGCANEGYRILSVMRHHALFTVYDGRIFRIEERNRDVRRIDDDDHALRTVAASTTA